ncbi:copper amine oxidase N-terminal domain-containing protein [Brevibacillus centrosporus]
MSQDTTMIPLSLLTSAFGVGLQYDSQNQMIELSYNGKVIKLSAGSKQAWVNSSPVTLTASPEVKSGKTMVPLTLLTQVMGLQAIVDAKTKDVSIVGSRQEEIAAAGVSLDSDLGKTMIGDSYYGWSMKYPTGFVNDPKQPYARLISKDSGGWVYEERAYQSRDRIFYVTLVIYDEADFRNPAKYSGYKDLLDSFTLSYPKGSSTVKDLSTVEGNFRWYTQEDMGLKLKVPANWQNSYNQAFTQFSSADGRQWIKVKITSKEEGLTLEDWAKRHEQMYRDQINESYLKVDSAPASTMVAGVPAIEQKFSSSDGAFWYSEHDFFFFKGNYKVYVEIAYDPEATEQEKKELVQTIKQSLTVNQSAMNPAMGEIADDDLVDQDQMATIKFAEQKFSISIPEHWKEIRGDGITKTYEFLGGNAMILAGPGKIAAVRKEVEQSIKENSSSYAYLIKDNKPITVAGANGYKLYVVGNNDGARFEKTIYLLETGKNMYMIAFTVSEWVKTKAIEQRLQKIIDSIQFTDGK